MKETTVIAQSNSLASQKSSVLSDISMEAAQHNGSILQDFFLSQAGSTLAFGSEFHPAEQLPPLLRQHPGFNKLAEILVSGAPCRCSKEITKKERETEALAALTRGNHESAQEEPKIVEQLLSKDAVHGFAMVVLTELVPLIPEVFG